MLRNAFENLATEAKQDIINDSRSEERRVGKEC